jgi:hypothetical protein
MCHRYGTSQGLPDVRWVPWHFSPRGLETSQNFPYGGCMSKRRSCRLSTYPAREELRAAESRAVRIRKQLTQLIKAGLGGEKVSDALQLVRTIEELARYGRVCGADDAVGIRSRIEALAWMLQNEIDGLVALQVR